MNKKRRIVHNLFQELFPKLPSIFFILFLKHHLKDCKTILDVGCGDNSPIKFIDGYSVGIDVNPSLIRIAQRKRTHNQYKVGNINKLNLYFKKKSFDAVVALDVIEHLSKKGGKMLISNMEKLAKKKVIIFTPNGFSPHNASRYDRHVSGWTTKEFETFNYNAYGMFGPKLLRGEYHKILYKPEFVWGFISDIIQWTYCIYFPRAAAALLCIKLLK